MIAQAALVNFETAHSVMLSCVASSAESQKIRQGIISKFFRRGDALAIRMMHMQILLGAAVLAGMVVSLKRLMSIAAKVEVIKRPFLIDSLLFRGYTSKPVYFFCLFAPLATWAPMLRPRLIYKILRAFGADQNGAFRKASGLYAKFFQVLNILLLPIGRDARGAHYLCAACRLILGGTESAYFWLKSLTCLAVSGKRARLTSLHISTSPLSRNATVKAFNSAEHDMNPIRCWNIHILP